MRTLHIENYYTCMKQLLKRYDKYARKNGLRATTKEEYLAWQKDTREILEELIGLDRMEACDLEPVVIEQTRLEGITREKVIIQVEPDVWMPMYILIPDDLKKNNQNICMIAPHGHCGGGKYTVAGCEEIAAIQEKIEFFNYDYGMQLAKKGYIVFCPDARGAGERRELAYQSDSEEHFLGSTCFHLAHMALPLGQTVIGMLTWDLMRLIDYIETREDCDSNHIGCAGFSGGGMQTLWLSALDDRIKYSVVSGYFYGYKDSLLKLSGNCSCNYVPRLWEHVDMGDIGALIAPRPLLVESGTEDHLNGERGVINAIEQVEIARKAYELCGNKESLVHSICEGTHRWYGQDLAQFLKQIRYK